MHVGDLTIMAFSLLLLDRLNNLLGLLILLRKDVDNA